MTDSIARFQRDATDRERLSSLGRLSTVVAHEIRNPLMIIKTSVRTLKRQAALPEPARMAAADIDEEVDRLNRIVGEVLDFARPIRFELAPLNLRALCSGSVAAVTADASDPAMEVVLDPAAEHLTTDGERLRLALVNVLLNARHAVLARRGRDDAATPTGGADITLETRRLDDSRVAIVVRDRGIGIAPSDLTVVFDPYFTTKRTGSGLGLAITKNIIEGLGGTITATSQGGAGTEMRIELPHSPLPLDNGIIRHDGRIRPVGLNEDLNHNRRCRAHRRKHHRRRRTARPRRDAASPARAAVSRRDGVLTEGRGAPPHINAYGGDGSGQQRLLGFAFLTTELEPLERGHDDPIQMLVGMDTTGVLTGSIVVDHNEPFRYVSVDPPECAEQCKARSIRNAFKVGADVEAISRASMTVRRATRAVKHSARRFTRQLIVPPGASQ